MTTEPIIQLENKFYIAANSSYADSQVKVLNHVDTFGIFDRWGDIRQIGEGMHGLYHEGTRFLSRWEFRLHDVRPLLLSSSIKEENVLFSIDLTNDIITSLNETQHKISKSTLHIARNKFIRNGACYENISIHNFGSEKATFSCSISFEADFKDIFEIRGIERKRHGEIFEIKHVNSKKLSIKYKGLDEIIRETDVTLSQPPSQWRNQFTAVYNVSLKGGADFSIEYSVACKIGSKKPDGAGFAETHQLLEKELKRTRETFPAVFTSNEQFNHWMNRSQADLLSLLAGTQIGYYPYAGVPWYNTPFGRDGIITSLQILWAAPSLVKDALLYLANTQAVALDENADAEPGKIFHEIRGGEMVETGEIPFKRYYGSIDSTPLFIVLAGAYYQRTGDLATIKAIWPNIEAALQWINRYGDIDGDGFVEYQHKSINGLINQGWKDSHDSISHQNGDLASPPIALCEVQGYVYDAKMRASQLAMLLKKDSLAETLNSEALRLKQKFNEVFWDEELRTYVLALDGNKEKCRVKSSNAGHLLYSGIADMSKARDLVNTLMNEEMFSGWGIRTLGSDEKRYNPMSYHNGSVWPHDVSLIAAGFARYGFNKEMKKLLAALFDASLFIDLQRLPELFCGFNRRQGEGPTAYPVACSPQAWSVGAIFLLLESCLHIQIDGVNRRITFRKPTLPDFMDNLSITDLPLGHELASFELHRYKSDTAISILKQPADWEINWIK